MASERSKKLSKSEDLELLRSEVAAFASSIGLASSGGFDDSDFRKIGPMKPQHPPPPDKRGSNPNLSAPATGKGGTKHPKPRNSPLDNIDPFGGSGKAKGRIFPLMNASSLSRLWYEDADELERKVLGDKGAKIAGKSLEELKEMVAKKKEVAEKLMQQFVDEYQADRRRNSKDMHMVETTVKTGTTADKVSALTCLIEDNPLANLKSLDSLLHMVTAKVGKRYAFTSFDALKELFMCRLLPDRKLKGLVQRPLDFLSESKDGNSLLLFWYWEELLKHRYEKFVLALEEASKDMLPNLKDKSIKLMYILLCGKAEQEQRLLSALVNKLGDPGRKSASGAGYYLSCLLSAHPNMKAVVIGEVDSFIFRPNVGLRAKYHAVNFLSQIFLSKVGDGPKVAKRLVDVYFALFKVLISENSVQGEINKCCKSKKLYGKRMSRGNEKRQSLKEANTGSSDSLIEMDSRLLSAILTGINRAFPYIASEEVDDLIEVQTPILFKLAHSKNFNVGVQALMLLYQISSKNLIASDRFYRALYSKLLSPIALNSSKPELFLSLLAKALKTDINVNRIAAFAKRILQVSLHQPSQYACGCLFLLSEILKAKPPLWNLMLHNESADEDLEHFEDIIEGSVDGEDTADLKSPKGKNIEASEGNDNNQKQTSTTRFSLPAGYDPRHREPSYCKADLSSWWELCVLASHVHPSVATMARTLLSGAAIVYNGDPLNDLSLASFLDKFMEKKPKQNQRADGVWHGGSQIAPSRKLDTSNGLVGEKILQLAEEDVPPEDIIFHKFYLNKSRSVKNLKKKNKNKRMEVEELAGDLVVGDDASEEEIDDVMGLGHLSSREADKDYDYDDLDDAALEDDDDLLVSDEEIDMVSHKGIPGSTEDDMDVDNLVESNIDGVGEASADEEGASPEQLQTNRKKRNRKNSLQTESSPFASLEDYEHLIGDGGEKHNKQKHKQKTAKKKKRT